MLKVAIEPRMVNSLQFRKLGVQNTTAVYPWFLANISMSLHQHIQQQTKAHIDLR